MKKLFYSLLSLVLLAVMVIPLSTSASNDLQIGDEVDINGIKATIIDFQRGQPVYKAVIYPAIYSSTSDGYLYYTDANYNTARTSVNAEDIYTGYTTYGIGNTWSGSVYAISRSYLYFNTAVLSGYTITAGSINLYVNFIGDNDGESIQVQSGMATYPHDPLVVGDYDLSNYAGNGGSKDITTFATSAYNAITLNATGYGWVNTSGWTKYCLRTTGDINNTAPTSSNLIQFFPADDWFNRKPYLSLTFTALTPAVISVAASNIATTTARLNSTITEDGGDKNCQIRFGYGTTTQTAANFLLYDTVTAWVAGYEEGENPYLDVASLNDDDDYYYRVQVKNETATVTSTDEQTFHTLANVDDMLSFLGYPDDDNISLDWVRAEGATNTVIRYRLDTYPTSETGADGSVLVYNGTSVSYVHSGLDGGTTYYYSAWGESGGVYSTNEVNLVMTTTDSLALDELPAISAPSGWFQEPDETFLAHLQPFYSVINGLADTWGMPRGNMWFSLVMLFVMLVGILSYTAFRAPAFSLMLMAVVMSLFVMMHILPQFMFVLVGFLALGAWGTRPQGI